MNRTAKAISALLIIAILSIFIVVSCHWNAFRTAERTMEPYTTGGMTEYVNSRFGFVDGKGPTWLFFYNSPVAFDTEQFTVEVSFLGELRNVYPPRPELWNSARKKWLMVPSGKGLVPAPSQ